MKLRTLLAAFAAVIASTTALADLDFSAFAHRATIDFDGGDYTFGSSSPLFNKGVKLSWMESALDLAGRTRLVGKPDIGCYESPLKPQTVFLLQ